MTQKIKSAKWKKQQPKRLERTRTRIKYLRDLGYTVTEMWECDFLNKSIDLEADIEGAKDKYIPPFTRCHEGSITKDNLLEAVESGKFFGMVECDIEVNTNYD